MSAQINLQPAYVLHTRAYRETSLLVELFTSEFGRVSVVAKGAKKPKSSLRGSLQPFRRLLVSWSGKYSLKTLRSVEDQYTSMHFQSTSLYSGLYVNELLVRLLKSEDHHAEGLFDVYEHTLAEIMVGDYIEPTLREFEKYLIEDLGYGLPFPELPASEAATLTGVNRSDSLYYYAVDGHFVSLEQEPNHDQIPRCFWGKHLQAIAASNYEEEEVLRAAKRLMRLALSPLLGDRPLQSRKLFKH